MLSRDPGEPPVALPLDGMGSVGFWRDLLPGFKISDRPFRTGAVAPARFDSDLIDRERSLQLTEGHLRLESVLDRDVVQALADATSRFVELGIPTTFLFLYDEVWQLFESLERYVAELVGPEFLLGADMWVWYLAPDAEARGWGPHRDDQFLDRAFGEDGAPNLVSLWISLSDATVDNGCMYVLPKSFDPNPGGLGSTKELPRAALPGIRAQPVPAGSVLSWTPDVFHWGARSTSRAEAPRISLCVYAQRNDCPPMTDDMVTLDSSLPFHHRLGFICRTMIRYRKSGLHPSLSLDEELAAFCEKHEQRLQIWLAAMRGIS